MHSDPATYDVIIIGAGAAGMFCAAACGARGRSVLVLDHAGRTGSKVRISGGGKCNFTNLHVSADHYRSSNPHFCRSALAQFTPEDMLDLIARHGIRSFEKEQGQLFCEAGAREIVALLEAECGTSGAEVRLGHRVRSITKEEDFRVDTDQGLFRAGSLVIATGGLSYAKLGASGFGYEIARQFGLQVIDPAPALVPFLFSAQDRKAFGALAGVSLDAVVQCGKRSFRGNILFTHQGLSGPAALQASLSWEPGLPLVLDLLPGRDIAAVFQERRRSTMTVRNLLAGFLPKRFSQAWCDVMQAVKPLDQTSDRELREIAQALHAWAIVPKGTEGYETAEVTRGGVDTDELSSRTMEAKKVPGLYFIGEVLDVTGELGGYNLHWAWASGHTAGQYA